MRFVLAVALASLLLPQHPVAASVPTTHLTWARLAGAESCLDRAELMTSVESRLERSVFSDVGEVRIEGEARREGSTFVVRFVLSNRGERVGERILRTDVECRRLDESIAVVVALLVELGRESVVLAVPSSVRPEASREATSEPRREARSTGPGVGTVVAPFHHEPTSWGVSLSLDGELARGLLPGWATAIGGSVETRAPRWVSLRADLVITPDVGVGFDDARGARFQAWVAGLGPCVDGRFGVVAFGGCLEGRLGRIRGTGFGFSESRSGTLLWSAVRGVVRVRILVPTGRSALFVEARLALDVSLTTTRFLVRPDGIERVAHDPGLVVPGVGVALGASL